MIRNSPARVPLWLAKRQWRLDGRKPLRVDRCRPELRDRLRRERWRPFYAYRYHWLDGHKRGDGADSIATFRLVHRMRWRFHVGRRWRWRWRPPADWSRVLAEAFNTYGPTPF